MNNRLIKSNDAGGGACANTVDLYNPFPFGGGVALYQLNGDATDFSGNYDGNFVNPAYTTGVFGQAAVFNGSSSYISNVKSLSFGDTMSVWFKGTSNPVDGDRVVIYNAYDSTYDWVSVNINYFSSNWYLNMQVRNTTGDYLYKNAIVTLNEWNLLTFSFVDNNTYSATINQANITLNTTIFLGSISSLASNTIYIGRLFGNNDDIYGKGSIDQVRIFNRALRPYEVEALYTEEYCTPTIVPSEHFNTVTYTAGTTDGTYQITGSSFQPDFIWVKNRDNVEQHYLIDSVRGLTNMTDKFLQSSTGNSESSASANVSGTTVTAIPGGFEVVETSINSGEFYFNGRDYVAWNFKAGGAAVTNTDGTITSQVSANTEAGFSIVSYTGNSSSGSTVGHGLSDTPKMIIVKSRNEIGGSSKAWTVYSEEIGNTQHLYLNTTDAASVYNFWNNTSPTNSVFSLSSDTNVNSSVGNYIAYCFAEVEGFSNFGSYVGTGVSGNTVVTGFEPAFLMVKLTSAIGGQWVMYDNKRNISNPITKKLAANSSIEENNNSSLGDDSLHQVNFLTNGFELLQAGTGVNTNKSGETYIYMAFAADPTTIEPTLEDSFNTVVYSGNGTSQPITGVGFQPDFVWIKDRTVAYHHILQDSVRGVNSKLGSDGTWEENSAAELSLSYGQITSFDSDGFSVNGTIQVNTSGTDNMVAWAWKGAELPAINSNGSIPSVVSANPAAGFSISTYSGKTGGGTTGHGLNSEPEFIIFKRYTAAQNWFVFAKINNVWNVLEGLNTSNGATDYSPYFSANDSIINWYNANEYNSDPASSYLAYSFHSVAGFSKFGSYSGGSTGSGNVIDVGFKPLFLMVKRTDAAGDAWQMFDSVRGGGDTFDNYVQANNSAAEVSYNQREVNFTNNGFYWTFAESGSNISGGTYIYMAFANQF